MSEIHFSDQLKSMSGPIRYSLTNDAVFHIAMDHFHGRFPHGQSQGTAGFPAADPC